MPLDSRSISMLVQRGETHELRLRVVATELVDAKEWSEVDAKGHTPLHWACYLDQAEAVGLLLLPCCRQLGVDPLALTRAGNSIVHLAALSEGTRVLTLLKESQCGLEALAARAGPAPAPASLLDCPVVSRASDAGAQPVIELAGDSPVSSSLAAVALKNFRNQFGETPLHLAAASGKGAVVAFLLRSAVDPGLLDHHGRQAHLVAVGAGGESALAAFWEEEFAAVMRPVLAKSGTGVGGGDCSRANTAGEYTKDTETQKWRLVAAGGEGVMASGVPKGSEGKSGTVAKGQFDAMIKSGTVAKGRFDAMIAELQAGKLALRPMETTVRGMFAEAGKGAGTEAGSDAGPSSVAKEPAGPPAPEGRAASDKGGKGGRGSGPPAPPGTKGSGKAKAAPAPESWPRVAVAAPARPAAPAVPAGGPPVAISKIVEFPGDPELLAEQLKRPDRFDIAGKDMFGLTALMKFAAWNRVDLLQPLLAKARQRFGGGRSAGEEGGALAGFLNAVHPETGYTALLHAADMGAAATLRVLLREPGVDGGVKDNGGRDVRTIAEANGMAVEWQRSGES